MGRVKLKIQRLETLYNRQITYAKRKSGLMKKASELSTLCDVDLFVLSFSPGGKPSLCVGEKSDLASMVEKISTMTLKDRSMRKSETLEILKKVYKHDDHVVDTRKFSDDKKEQAEMLKEQLDQLQQEINEKNIKLSTWMNPESIDNPELIKYMEDSLMVALGRLGQKKEQLMDKRKRTYWTAASANRVPWIPLGVGNPNPGFSQSNLGCFASTAIQNEYEGGVGLGSQNPLQHMGITNQIQQFDFTNLCNDASLPSIVNSSEFPYSF